ncbi:MAG: two-component sensor histidine kinase [Symbiobacteriaceae bacterium]|jgi:signal transduction histidine kinase|nr:two-component sensor histidine kinase [Symbiobacteriaceae bacterium]
MKGRFLRGPLPLALQLTLAFTLLVAAAFGGGGAFLTQGLQERQLAVRTDEVLAKAREAAALVGQTQSGREGPGLSQALFTYQQQKGVRPIVIGSDGVVVGDSWLPSPFLSRRLELPEVQAALAGQESAGLRRIAPDGLVLYAAVPLRAGANAAGAVLVSASLRDLDQQFAVLKGQMVWVMAGAGLLSLLLGWGLARTLARPLERLAAATTELARGDLGVRVDPGGSLETAALGHRFNRMAEELALVEQQRRNFIGAASHELRTPVASIRSLGEAIISDDSADLAIYREYVGDILTECDQAAHLVDRMLELTRLEGRIRPQPGVEEPLELVGLITAVVKGLRPLAHSRGVDLAIAASDPVWIAGESWLVETIVDNLVENATKYTPPGGAVWVEVARQGAEARVTVSDTGPGIAPEHLPHLFERFYRADKSRARATGGVGLGLSIAAEAAVQLGGRIMVDSTPGKGSRFTLVVPAAAP